MLLIAVATEMERAPLAAVLGEGAAVRFLVTGVGPAAAAVAVGSYLAGDRGREISLVLNAGVGGAFVGGGAGLLDICVAESETDGDFGICLGEDVRPFSLYPPFRHVVPPATVRMVSEALCERGLIPVRGPFVTVNAVSATARRGANLGRRHRAVLENMEGASVARACRHHDVPFAAIRAVSNMVEDRDRDAWRLDEALERLAVAAAAAVPVLVEEARA